MRTRVDGAGRLVIPREIRRRLDLVAGQEVEVLEEDGTIRISFPARPVRLVEGAHGLLTADPQAGLPADGPDEVRDLLERMRR